MRESGAQRRLPVHFSQHYSDIRSSSKRWPLKDACAYEGVESEHAKDNVNRPVRVAI